MHKQRTWSREILVVRLGGKGRHGGQSRPVGRATAAHSSPQTRAAVLGLNQRARAACAGPCAPGTHCCQEPSRNGNHKGCEPEFKVLTKPKVRAGLLTNSGRSGRFSRKWDWSHPPRDKGWGLGELTRPQDLGAQPLREPPLLARSCCCCCNC